MVSSKEAAQKCKQFIMTSKMIGGLLTYLKAFRTKIELGGLYFDKTKTAQSGHHIENLEKSVFLIHSTKYFVYTISSISCK